MKCLSRSTLGVVIGAINISFFSIFIIYIITILCEASSLSEEDMQDNADILTASITLLNIILVICVISLVTSFLLVVGIVKQRHTFMKPWIYSAILGIAFYILRIIIAIIVGLTTGLSFANILGTLVIGLLTLGLQFLIFYPIYTLYVDFRDAANAQEQRGLNYCPQNAPSYGELEKGGEMYN